MIIMISDKKTVGDARVPGESLIPATELRHLKENIRELWKIKNRVYRAVHDLHNDLVLIEDVRKREIFRLYSEIIEAWLDHIYRNIWEISKAINYNPDEEL